MQSIRVTHSLSLTNQYTSGNIIVLLLTLLVPQLGDGYLCFVVCVHTTTIFLQGFWGGHRQDFGDDLCLLGELIPHTCVLLDSPMMSFRVRSSSLLEPEHSRITPHVPFALLDMIQHVAHPFQVRYEQPVEGTRVGCHEQPGFRCPLHPVRLPASQHNCHRRCGSQPTKSAVRVVLLMKTPFLHGFQYFLL